jgi:O-acetylhomoserine/O-acetylserine sulfhydrylase-like pyridoxal-dependent enzyme
MYCALKSHRGGDSRSAWPLGGRWRVATASGQAALHLAVVTLMGQAGTWSLLQPLRGSGNRSPYAAARFGITTTFVLAGPEGLASGGRRRRDPPGDRR